MNWGGGVNPPRQFQPWTCCSKCVIYLSSDTEILGLSLYKRLLLLVKVLFMISIGCQFHLNNFSAWLYRTLCLKNAPTSKRYSSRLIRIQWNMQTLYSRVFWIFLPNVIKIAPYNFERTVRFKIGAVFWNTVVLLCGVSYVIIKTN